MCMLLGVLVIGIGIGFLSFPALAWGAIRYSDWAKRREWAAFSAEQMRKTMERQHG